MQQIVLGKRYRDIVTGFTGIATCRVEYLNGCVRVGITPTELTKDGKSIESEYVDVDQVELLDDGIITKMVKAVKSMFETGGPQDRKSL
jgi:hypothetical protein